MKTKFTFVCLLIVWMLSACQAPASSAPAATTVSNEFILALGQSAAVTGTDLIITFDSIVSDERCPSEVECAVSGPVTISLSIQAGNDAPTDLTLQTFTDPDGRSPNVQFEGVTNRAEVGGYRIQITSVTPYPKNSTTKIEPSGYRLGLLVTNN